MTESTQMRNRLERVTEKIEKARAMLTALRARAKELKDRVAEARRVASERAQAAAPSVNGDGRAQADSSAHSAG